MGILLYIPTNNVLEFLFLHVFTNTCCFLIFYCCYSHPSECEVVAYYGFDLHFLFLNWSIIDLQYYVSFRCTAKWFDFIKPWCWETVKAGGEGDNRGWDGWMASPTRWTWVWASSGSWWRTGKPGMLQFMGSQIAGQDMPELNWIGIDRVMPLVLGSFMP